MNTAPILAIDAGNTRIKWCLFNASGNIVEQGACQHAELASVTFPLAPRIVISNVAGNAIQAQIRESLPTNAAIQCISAQSAACGVSNHYEQPTALGSDRWAALIAAWHIHQAPCVVVNAGTAVTIDALSVQRSNHHNPAAFIGGLILPGLDLMQQSLGLATAHLPKIPAILSTSTPPRATIFAKNTADAIHAGALHAISSSICVMARELRQQTKQSPYILISGGNAATIYEQVVKDNFLADMAIQALIVDNLVLQGLYLLENFYAK